MGRNTGLGSHLFNPVLLLLVAFSATLARCLEQQRLHVTGLPERPVHKAQLAWTRLEEVRTSKSAAGLSIEASLHVRLEHRDVFSESKTKDLFLERLERDAQRVNVITSLSRGRRKNRRGNVRGFSSRVVSGLPQGSGEYFTNIGVGTPAKNTSMVLDTGSDIIWLQCAPCDKCYSQSFPLFDPASSLSYRRVNCSSSLCLNLEEPGCSGTKSCIYHVSYGDGSFTTGDFSTETLTFGRKKIQQVALGCGHDNEGLFVGASGLLGLGRGNNSFPSQIRHRFTRKFSYCLVDRTSSSTRNSVSTVIFGPAAVPKSARFTPMLSNPKLDTFYYVGLTGISVGNVLVDNISELSFRLDDAGNGGIIIDSGTSVTRLVAPAYTALRNAFVKATMHLNATTDGFSLFDTCYNFSGKTEVQVPTLAFHFHGDAKVTLPASNYLIPVNNEGRFCFAFAGISTGLSIIGNIQQQGFRVVFDADASRIGFAPHSCT